MGNGWPCGNGGKKRSGAGGEDEAEGTGKERANGESTETPGSSLQSTCPVLHANDDTWFLATCQALPSQWVLTVLAFIWPTG